MIIKHFRNYSSITSATEATPASSQPTKRGNTFKSCVLHAWYDQTAHCFMHNRIWQVFSLHMEWDSDRAVLREALPEGHEAGGPLYDTVYFGSNHFPVRTNLSNASRLIVYDVVLVFMSLQLRLLRTVNLHCFKHNMAQRPKGILLPVVWKSLKTFVIWKLKTSETHINFVVWAVAYGRRLDPDAIGVQAKTAGSHLRKQCRSHGVGHSGSQPPGVTAKHQV